MVTMESLINLKQRLCHQNTDLEERGTWDAWVFQTRQLTRYHKCHKLQSSNVYWKSQNREHYNNGTFV